MNWIYLGNILRMCVFLYTHIYISPLLKKSHKTRGKTKAYLKVEALQYTKQDK